MNIFLFKSQYQYFQADKAYADTLRTKTISLAS